MKFKIIIILSVLTFVSCKTTRTIPKSDSPATSPIEQVIEQVQQAQPHFTSANVSKMSLELTYGERNVNVSATCKIKKDSIIHLSIQPFMGIELFKAEIAPDSIRVFDKMNRRYFVTDYSYFKKRFGVEVDFNSLQALIFNQFFCIGKKAISSEGCMLSVLDAKRNRIDYESENTTQSTDISAEKTIQQIILRGKNAPYQLQLNYEDYFVENNVNFPQKIAMKISSENNNASCNFSILKVQFNTDMKFNTANTDRYTRADIEQLLKK